MPFDIARLRMQNQRIVTATFKQPEEVVRWMGAMQAQDYGQAIWGIGARMPATTKREVEQAIADGKIIRTWPMRGTIHFVPPQDARWMLQLSAAHMIAKDSRRLNQLELDETIMKRCQALFVTALQDHKKLTRAQMMQVLEDGGISTNSQRGYHILWYLAQLGVLCIGPMDGKEQTFALLDEWVADLRTLSREEGLVELARRYFISHGLATVHDFAWWAGLTVTEAKAGLEANKSLLICEKVDKREYWMDANAPMPNKTASTVLLAGFDEYLLGYKDRSNVLDPQHADKVCPGGNGVFYPMIVSNGQIVGTWKRTFKKDTVIFTRDAFRGLSNSKSAAYEAAAQRYANFMELRAVLA